MVFGGNQNISPLLFMQNLVTSSATNPSSQGDEEIGAAPDEPPDSYFHPPPSAGKFSKLFFKPLPPKESLLTRALLLATHSTVHIAPSLERGLSAYSDVSNASTAELTNDSLTTNPSRAHSPSPPFLPPPVFVSQISADTPTVSKYNKDELDIKNEGKTRIKFVCGAGKPEDGINTLSAELFAKRPVGKGLKFVCSHQQQPLRAFSDSRIETSARKVNTIELRESDVTVKETTKDKNRKQSSSQAITIPESRSIYDSESTVDSWANQPIDKSRFFRVDDMLKKEKDIRKLSEEVEQEEGDDMSTVSDHEEGDDQEDAEEDEDNEDEDEDGGEDGDDDEYYGRSGNESDNEEGFASDDDSDDDEFFGARSPLVYIRRSSHSYENADVLSKSVRHELPDSTDFVCGTFDEDQPLEQAYLSCLEELKRSKHKTTPQDIDPSFPDSDLEDSDRESPVVIGPSKKVNPHSDGGSLSDDRKSIFHTRSPRGRVHSPAPAIRHASPAPHNRLGRRTHFYTNRNIVRSRSLPRYPGGARRLARTSRGPSTAASPRRSSTRPMMIRRGAIDIVKGLEKKRERRKARLGKYKEKEGSWKAGEGVEKMRILGLEICGKGRPKQGIWMMSA